MKEASKHMQLRKTDYDRITDIMALALIAKLKDGPLAKRYENTEVALPNERFGEAG